VSILNVIADCFKVGAVFILDEVMTSRLAPGGLQSTIGLKPDLAVFGKYLGGGLAFGAFGGREDIMSVYDPRSPKSLAHSGTFNNNTLAMHVGYVGLSQIWTPEVAVEFNKFGDRFREDLQKVAKGTKMSVTGQGALNAIHFSDAGTTNITCVEDIEENWALKDLFYMEMMEDGFWLTRRGSLALILGTPKSELEKFVACVERFLERHRRLVSL
jgi:glutamate-1-semialdehyde 2,1-aminomutase